MRLSTASAALAVTLIGTTLGAGPGLAQPDLIPAPVLAVSGNEGAQARRIDLTQGRSVVIDLPQDAKEVFVANPKVANAVVRSTRKVFVIGIENGATSIFIMNADGRQIAALDVTVGRDLNVLRQTLSASLPNARLDVRPAGDSIVLSGFVNSSSEAQQAVDVANAFVGIGGAGGPPVRGAVINNLTIRGKDQVMLRVTVVEVSRVVLKQFGIDAQAGWSGFSFANATPFALNGQNTPSGNAITGSFNHAGITAKATLRAFEQAGVSRILAEPTLTAVSGESAKFTAGGEIPVPASQTCGTTITGAVGGCQISIEYKPYGVTLNFTPVVLSENRVSIRVGTEVTELDPQKAITLANGGIGINVPATTKRTSETTVELPSGAVMMTAGLIQQKSQTAINGLPGLINLPILGALFRSRDYQRQETELVIMVTPLIAKPMDARQATRPDDGFTESHDAKGVLLGRINKLYGTVGGAPLGPNYRGRFGFITD